MMETLTKTKEENQINITTTSVVSGHVRIENGDTVIEGKNKITSRLLRDLINFIGGQSFNDNNGILNRYYNNPTYNYVYLGTDTTTPTNSSTDALIAPIGSPTKCSSISSTYWGSGGAYYVQWMATFNPGTVSGTVGEMGLYLYCGGSTLGSFGGTYALNGSAMVARYAVADGEFSAFTIDTTKPVVVVWTFKIETDGKILYYGLINIANHIACYDDTSNFYCPCYNWTSHSSSYSCMVLGSDTTTVNTVGMTALVSPIGSGIGTVPNTQSGSITQSAVGDYLLSLTAVWNAGSVSGTVGEIGLYLYGDNTWRGLGTLTPSGCRLYARLSNADSHFSSFSIDTGKNLTITWQWRFLFS